eukprot:gnl/Dysnectes_brevis/1537_a1745_2118.p1 GENE.gnl/Dysnectes_brevis/1537_a1745_2118~~gnl/Dysnectes_brevis/1537_a1745_2118.p1  ORF type:complete len:245 (+),score=30.32 gnl/Dysnectes_brevis/1537_a1745_2118:482-1216(+)
MFRVASFNLHGQTDHPLIRIDLLAKKLAEADFDVIAFQEVCNSDKINIRELLIEKLCHYGYPVKSSSHVFTHKAWDVFDEELLIVSKHKSTNSDKGDLPHSPLNRSFASLTAKGFTVISTHLSHLKPEYRHAQMTYLADKFKSAPAILAGDFNSSPHDWEQKPCHEAGFSPAFPGSTFPAHNPRISLDGMWYSAAVGRHHLAVSQGLLFHRPFTHTTCGATCGATRRLYLSDHLGVYLELIKKT